MFHVHPVPPRQRARVCSRQNFSVLEKFFLPDTLTSVLGLKDSHAQSSRAMPLRVLLQSRLGWPFEAMKDPDASSEKSCRSSLQTKGGTRLCSPFTLVTSWCSQRRSSPSALMVHMSSPKGYEIKLYRPGKVFPRAHQIKFFRSRQVFFHG